MVMNIIWNDDKRECFALGADNERSEDLKL